MIFGDEDKRLLIQAALSPPPAALAAFDQWLLRNTLYDAPFSASRLFPLVYRNIGPLIVEKSNSERLRGLARHTWLSNQLRIQLCTTALASLAKAGIPTLLLKGAALGTFIEADHTVRQMGDCDILVPHDQARSAVNLLAEFGLTSIPIDVKRFGEARFEEMHGVGFRNKINDIDVIDLHWRPLREVLCPELTEDFFRTAKPVKLAGIDVMVPTPENLFLHSAIHGGAWDPVGRFDWVTDLMLILRARASQFDWDQLVNSAQKYGCSAMLASALLYSKKISDIVVPEFVVNELRISSSFLDRYEAKSRERVAPTSTRGEIVCSFQRLKRSNLARIRAPLLQQIKDVISEKVMRDDNAPQPNGQGLYEADLVMGWHFLEPEGRWSNGKLAFLRLPHDPKLGTQKLRLKFQVLDGHKDRLTIFLGRHRVQRIEWETTGPRVFSVDVDIPQSEENRRWLRVTFRLQRPTSPIKLRTSQDERVLGILLQDIRIIKADEDESEGDVR